MFGYDYWLSVGIGLFVTGLFTVGAVALKFL